MHGLGLAGRVTVWCCVALVPAAAVAAPVPGPAAAPADAAPKQIRVVGDDSYPPYLFADADGKVQGYEADLWRLFEAHTGIKVELRLMDWADAQQEILAGRADVIDVMYRTPVRERQYDFSAPYATLPVTIYTDRRIGGIRNVGGLRGFPVGVEGGDACVEKLRSLGVDRLQAYPTYQALVRAAVRGEVRIFCMDQNPADYFLYQNGALDQFDKAFVLYDAQLYRAVRKGNAALLAWVERGMAEVTPAQRAQLRSRWLAHAFVLAPYLRIARLAAAGVAALVALMLLWVWALRRTVAARTRAWHAEESNVRALFDASPDAVWIKDRRGRLLDANRRATDLLATPRGQMPEALQDRLRDADETVLRNGACQTLVCPLAAEGAGARQFEIIKVPITAADGSISGVLSAARDVTGRQQEEVRLRLWASAFEHGGFGMAVFDARTRTIKAVNPPFAHERGYAVEEMLGMSVHALYPPDLVAEREAARTRIDAQPHTVVETEQVTRDGRRFPVLLDCTVVHDAAGGPEYVIVYAQDISDRKRAESEVRLAAVAFQTQEALIVSDAAGCIQRVNQAFTRLTGFTPDEVLGTPMLELCARGEDAVFRASADDQVRHDGFWQGEQLIRVRQGQPRVVRTAMSAVVDAGGAVSHYVCTLVDLTGEREAHASIDRMTYFDPLTDLPNRQYLLGRLQHMLEVAGDGGVLLLADLDHFKRVNDLRGHAAGDRLLALVARRLRVLADGDCMLGRLGGGAFAMIVPCNAGGLVARSGVADEYARRLRQSLREPFQLDGGVAATLTASIGWTEWQPLHDEAESVLREAELAMYGAKAAGRDRVLRFDPEMLAELARREDLVQELRAAIGDDALDLYLQPQADRDGRVVSAEALLRWVRRDGRQVPPDAFIPIAEENGLIVALGSWVLHRACEQLVAWSADPVASALSLAVNVSAHQFAQAGFVDSVLEALAATGASPAQLKLEVTESAILGDLADAAMKLSRLRAQGIRISLDDFGTGYSSLAYLSRLPIDQLKIDKSFVMRLPGDATDAMVAQTIIGMGRGLGLEVMAEGVETEAQRRFLAQHGCDAFQGFLIARPLPAAEFSALLHGRATVS